jgi:predicted transcriptional regulator
MKDQEQGGAAPALTAGTVARQKEGLPGHQWSLATIEEAGGWEKHFSRVEQFMTSDLFTVGPDDVIDLVAAVMDWKRIRYVPVEDERHHLVGAPTASFSVSFRSAVAEEAATTRCTR